MMNTQMTMQHDTVPPKSHSYLAQSLRTTTAAIVDFDPANSDHRDAYLTFLNSKKWPIRFATKWPKSIEQTVMQALALHACGKELN